MRLRTRAVVVAFTATATLGFLVPAATAAPMPWDSHTAPAATTTADSAAAGQSTDGYHDNGYHENGHHENGQHENGHHDNVIGTYGHMDGG
ncbi:hypothetical protein AB0H97_06355 [Streptomyces sp. NPDC050788]|jgi:hypothetical protein|uniref:hypothetical protein n=1 Tax=Streptomyces sp. NPDC050788 TaxID=3155041 RepID=UPI00343604D8